MFLIECMCILSVLVIFSSVHAAGLNLVHELFSDMSASEAKHQGRLLHRVALVISISIKICMIFVPHDPPSPLTQKSQKITWVCIASN